MNKQIIWDLVLIGLMIVLTTTIIYLIVIFKQDSFTCLANPIEYYESLYNASCKCSVANIWSVNVSNLSLK
jgi:hypothetical protein